MFNACFSLSLFALAIANPWAAGVGAAIYYLGKNEGGKKKSKNKTSDDEGEGGTIWL